ncbi:hypothetical protein LTR56_014040 [Elasticomyces elasticus]|nr:hypothetical protein LTR56_014040 [Elasticomyces elasticus]KAK3647611.1 hypothetical protein LTR22_013666 [Elasticomyces elasticus]KAK4922292.1 hypothetical protein LTR49_010322 [Elasticomyces elasticus]KAK5763746.1 hypothetical protein LTS12_006079 [Elasticomyces elasticus]
MSTNGGSTSIPLAASGVSFTRVSDRNGESGSQAESSSSRSTRDRDLRKSMEDDARRSQDTAESSVAPERRTISAGHRHRASGGFLLGSGVMNGSPRASDLPHRTGKRKAQNGYLQVGKTRNPPSRLSVDSSVPGSPLSRQVSLGGPEADGEERVSASRPPSMDPAQLVQMALELSESRRRGVSGGLKLPSPGRPDSRRSSGLRPSDTARQASRQRRRASYTSDEPTRRASGRYSAEPQDGQQDAEQDPIEHDFVQNDVPRNFTPATLSRVERARKYFELASEHRRLLQHLPPLKPDADAPGNHNFVAMNNPGSTHPEISRVPSYLNNKHSLGRSYNPLQALRNRRLRNRERQPLPAPPETWQDTDSVGRWVDDVEAATSNTAYRHAPDRVELPKYAGDDGTAIVVPDTSKGHRRNDTVSSVVTRPENGWSIEPSELLADVYWTERGHHKDLLENRHGSPIFRRTVRRSIDKPRRSRDTARSSVDLQRAIHESEEVPFHKRAHRGTHLLAKRHGKLPRSGSNSSGSTDGGRSVTRHGHGTDDFENTGPLEKHMEELMAKYESGELTSPVLVSPDHWDSMNTQFPMAQNGKRRGHRDTLSQGNANANGNSNGNGNGRLSVDTARQHRRNKSADGRLGSIDGKFAQDEATEPLSPAITGFRQSLEVDREAAQPRGTFARQKTKLHKIPLFRSHSKERRGIEATDLAATSDSVPIAADTGAETRPRMSMESSRPSFIQRHRTNESFGSSVRQGTGLSMDSTKEGNSTMGRLLKAGRIGEIVRNESSRFGDRLRGRERPDDAPLDTASEASDDEGEHLHRQSMGDDDPSPRTSVNHSRTKPKYFLPNLPSFRSPMARGGVATPGSVDSDPIARQQRAQKEAGRTTRFDRLAPPRINLPAEEDELSTNRSDTYVDAERRKSYGFLGAKGSSNTSSISFAEQGPVGRSLKLRSGGQRHWSISDKPHAEQLSKVSARDVARVQALLLSSGVKAREIQRRANAIREQPLPLYVKIGETVGQDFPRVSKKEEHLVSSRMLSDHLITILSQFEQDLDHFQNGTAKQLSSQLDGLGRKAAGQLTTTVHDTSDDADAFLVELTTKVPQDVKRVDDAIEDILRERRRQFRLLRRAGFKLLEWLVLGIMWWLWFIVLLFQAGKRVVVGMLLGYGKYWDELQLSEPLTVQTIYDAPHNSNHQRVHARFHVIVGTDGRAYEGAEAVDNTSEDKFITILGPHGTILIRVFSLKEAPKSCKGNAAAIYPHGGGYTVGSVDKFEDGLRLPAEGSIVQVYGIDYRLAPEARHPTQLGGYSAVIDALQGEFRA